MAALPFLLSALLLAAPASRDSAARDSSAAASERAATPDSAGRPVTVGAVAPDSTTSRAQRIVRSFEAIEVRARMREPLASTTIHEIPRDALERLPLERLNDAFELQPGVVAHDEQLSVRGGRPGETAWSLDGVSMQDPIARRPLELPLAAIASADLVTGGLEADLGQALAGVVRVRMLEPTPRPSAALRWETDGRTGTHYDRVTGRVSSPIGHADTGVMLALEVRLDDTNLPNLRTVERQRVLGGSFGWRADDHLLGALKIGPVGGGDGLAFEAVAARRIEQPYDPMWSLDGWVGFVGLQSEPNFSPDSLPGYTRYRAADHLAMTDDRRALAALTWARSSTSRRLTLAASWSGVRRLTSLGASDDDSYVVPGRSPVFGFDDSQISDPFHVYLGDDPFFHREQSATWTLRGDLTRLGAGSNRWRVGAGTTLEHVELREMDGTAFGRGIDSLRAYDATAPGAFAYGQTRWVHEGLVVNAGLRLDWWTPGSSARSAITPGDPAGELLWSPRLGLAFPVTTRDVFSFAYVRLKQPPTRDVLYDSRTRWAYRPPHGDASLTASTAISYQAAVRHLVSDTWSFQLAAFDREVANAIGASVQNPLDDLATPYYANSDVSQANGVELAVLYDRTGRMRVAASYTLMQARGYDSYPEGVPYGPAQAVRPTPDAEYPLDWDRRQTLALSGSIERGDRWSIGWSMLLGSGLPWTPSTRRQLDSDLSRTNSQRLPASELTSLSARWRPRRLLGLELGLEVRNLFDERGDIRTSVDGYPHPVINTYYDDYGAYRTETGNGGGAYWNDKNGDGLPGWVVVHDARLDRPSRTVRVSFGRNW